METLLKWLNKPKADDKSLLARFFHADRALAAVASELDSFDGRAEPDRCSRLVSRLRQGQDKVLAITNLIIEELLGDERDPRAFRAKFPEEVLQENLAGQLWFGAECLAAGSSIMNREQESKEMRPLAEAVTRSLNNVRYLLRDQCLRNNVPNSERLNLDKNDAATEQLYESLKRFDRLFAEFEWRYVSAMVQVKSKEEYEMQELICVLCSETLQRALKLGLLEQDKVDAFDPALMFSIPRLAIVSGLVIYPDGPLDMDMPAEQLSEMFRPFRSILIKVREYLRNLNETELYYLERLLCTNEEISLKDTLKAKDSATQTDNNNGKSSKYSDVPDSERIDKNESTAPAAASTTAAVVRNNTTSKLQQQKLSKLYKTKCTRRADSPSPAPSTSSSSDECSPCTTPISSTPSSPRSTHSMASTTTAEETNGTTSPDSWIEDEEEIALEDDAEIDEDGEDVNDEDNKEPHHRHRHRHHNVAHYADDDDSDVDNDNNDLYGLNNVADHQVINLEIASADCATGYLMSNTTLGNLLQPQEVPLTDNFVVSDTDLPAQDDDDDEDADADAGECNDNMAAEMPTTSAKAQNCEEHDVDPQRTEEEQNERQEHIERANQDNNNSIATTASLSLHDSEISLSLRSSINNSSNANHSRRRRFNALQQTCNKDLQQAQHRHHHHHHHQRHHHHHHHHSSTTTSSSSSTRKHNSGQSHHHTSSTSSHCASSRHHRLHHHHRRTHPQRHGGDKRQESLQCDDCSSNVTKEDTTISNSKAATSLGLDIETPSSSSSLLDDNKTIIRSGGRIKFKNTENLLHRLFVCIAGVADQLQTNFAFDLRQILRSVFLINMSPAQEELDIPEKPKENELFEFRASENDVIQESAGSSQSIYSAEEVNPEGDNQSQNSNSSSSSNSANSNNGNSNISSSSSSGVDSNRVYRHSTGSTATPPTALAGTSNSVALLRQQMERSRSLDNQEMTTHQQQTLVMQQQQQQQLLQQPQTHQQPQSQTPFRNRHNSTGSTTTPSSLSSSENNSPVCERSTNSGTRRLVSESNANTTVSQTQSSTPPTTRAVVQLSPPAWIPDQKAPRCMSCNTPFTAFRRRHHCRNCGGVFCGVCSNTSAPLPKYGLTKAVRVCRACYVHELGPNANPPQNHLPPHNNQHQHQHHHHHHHSQLVSQATTNNEPSRLRRPVTTTRAID